MTKKLQTLSLFIYYPMRQWMWFLQSSKSFIFFSNQAVSSLWWGSVTASACSHAFQKCSVLLPHLWPLQVKRQKWTEWHFPHPVTINSAGFSCKWDSMCTCTAAWSTRNLLVCVSQAVSTGFLVCANRQTTLTRFRRKSSFSSTEIAVERLSRH